MPPGSVCITADLTTITADQMSPTADCLLIGAQPAGRADSTVIKADSTVKTTDQNL